MMKTKSIIEQSIELKREIAENSALLERAEYCTKARLVPKSMTLSLRLTALE